MLLWSHGATFFKIHKSPEVLEAGGVKYTLKYTQSQCHRVNVTMSHTQCHNVRHSMAQLCTVPRGVASSITINDKVVICWVKVLGSAATDFRGTGVKSVLVRLIFLNF